MRKNWVCFLHPCQLARQVNGSEEENRKHRETGRWDAMLICSERKQEQQKAYRNGNRRQDLESAPLRQVPSQFIAHPGYRAIALGMSTSTHS